MEFEFLKKNKTFKYIILGVLIFALGAFGGISGAALYENSQTKSANSSQIVKTSATEKATNDIMTIAKSAAPSVVEISTEIVTNGSFMRQYISEGAGSGVIITSDGYIVTNNHVIAGANSYKVTLHDGKEYDAKLIGADVNTDIAVLKIDAEGLSVAAIGDSDKLEVGETVVAIGNPLGELGGTVTDGIISATSREINVDGVNMHLLQTSAAINPGNSGGGLFNTNGELIGVVNAKSSGSDVEGLGFAIPSNTAIDVAEQIMKQGFADGNYVLGIRMVEIDENLLDQYNVDEPGVYVYEAVQGGNAEQAGIKSGDLLVKINGKKIKDAETAQKIVKNIKKGDELEIVIRRNHRDITIKIEA